MIGGFMKQSTQKNITGLMLCCVLCAFSICQSAESPSTEDGSKWEEVITPGFGNINNCGIVALAEYKGQLYVMTRNEIEGSEIWRTAADGSWEQVLFPGEETNGVYGNPWLTSMWGSMIVFKDKLYCGFSSGHQVRVYDSTGCEIWRYDGNIWEPVISDKKDTEEKGVITAIAGCDKNDGDVTARITDSNKRWEENQWAGGVLQITSGEGRFRHFNIITNTSDTLTVQQDEVAGNEGQEFTICGRQHFKNPSPPLVEYDRGAVGTGDSYEIGTGKDENGFGDFWNKLIAEMVIFDDKLFVSTAINYEHGAQIWYTGDGDTWKVTEPANSFGNFNTDFGYPNSRKPVSTSIPSLCASAVSGEPVLYAGGTGSSGDLGKCSRMAKLTDSGWELIVDVNVDENSSGTNENGFGCGIECDMWAGNFVPWSLADFQNKLFVGVQSLGGARVLYTSSGSSADGSWLYSVGGDSDMPSGFDGRTNRGMLFIRMYQNIAVNLFVFDNALYAGLVSNYSPKIGALQYELTGAQLWKTGNGTDWQAVTRNGFGDSHVVSFDSFAVFNGTLHVGAGKASGDGPDGLSPPEGAKLYRFVSQPHTPAPLFEKTDSYETKMPQNGDAADIYYPVADNGTDTFPIALLLQGARIDKSYYSQFARHVAQYGFIVVVPNHINMFSVPGFSEEGLFSEQQQLYDVLAFMASENDNSSSPVQGRVDTETLVMLGHSYGAACTLGAIQNTCEYPFCPEDATFTRPAQLKAAALCGINTKPFGNPFDKKIRATNNHGMPLAIINGNLDSNATYGVTKISYRLIDDPPKALVFINGANHFAMCDMNNPPGPTPQKNEPVISQEVSIETAARWSALFLRAHALNDEDAFDYIYKNGTYLDPNVEVFSESGQ